MSTLTTLTEDNKRWLVYGIALNRVLVPSIRHTLEQEILKEYNLLKTNHGIDVQTSDSFPVSKYHKVSMKYENINANDTKLKPPHYKRLDYSKFDYQVTSHVDFAKLFLLSHMAKFNAFNETCDASAVLNLFGRIPVFSVPLQNAANVVREGRNAWGHCNFADWNEANFKTRFDEMEQLVKEVGFSPADESRVLADIKDWEAKGVILCMNATIDPELAKVVHEHVSQLSGDVEMMAFETREDLSNLKMLFDDIQQCFQEFEERFIKIEREQELLQQDRSFASVKVDQLETAQKAVEKRVTDLEGQTSSLDFSSCEADVIYYAERYDPDTRQWLLKDFDTWFTEHSESRAYVLLGDAAVGKSVVAAVIAQRAKNEGNLAAAYFCRHYDGTRNDPRYLLGTIAHQLCNCNRGYDRVVGGDTGIHRMLANERLGVHELFTKLLEEPLGKCGCCERKLVVVDALDETEYWSREDFLDLIMNRFPQLPKWLVFFITSRPEDTVHFRLRTYYPCIRICVGDRNSAGFYEQHEQDIYRFLEKRLDSKKLAEDLTKKCNGMFLYAFYIVERFKNSTRLEGDIFPENINDFFYKNFERVYKKIGSDFYKKLFGCALVAPSPLPVAFISFILQNENSSLDEQEVVDSVSQFVAWRTSDKTFAFLHNLIPAWLTDKEKARRLFIDRNKAKEYLRKFIVEFISAYIRKEKELFSRDSHDLVDYVVRNGIRFLCNCSVESSDCSEIVFNCLTNYRFLQDRIQSKIGIYSLIEDFKFSIVTLTFNEKKKNVLDVICSAVERDKYVIAGYPELLYSCLRNAIKLSQENMMFSNVSTSWMELVFDFAFSVNETLCDMKCGAFSHDKKLFAGGKGSYIYLYDASSFRKFFGPLEVTSEDVLHLEFSPDDRFVFFGRLDSWFSVQEKRLVEITQFTGNSKCYKWGSFIYDGKYIALSQNVAFETHTRFCYFWIFYKWILKEFDLEQGNTLANIRAKFSSFRIGDLIIGEKLVSALLNLKEIEELGEVGLCSSCAEFENRKTPVRDRIVLLYADIFEYQIWNVETGGPVMEEMFSSEVNLEPFFYLWHFFLAMNGLEGEICNKSMTLGNVAALNFIFGFNAFAKTQSRIRIRTVANFPFQNSSVERLTYFVTNTPVECCNNILKYSSVILSKDGRWLACERPHQIKVFEIEIGGKVLLNHRQDLHYAFAISEAHAFTSDSNILIYVTGSATEGRILCALSLHTGTKLQSISGLYPVRCESVDGHAIGYVFCGRGEKRLILLKDLPYTFLCHLRLTRTERINLAFTSTDKITLICSDAMYMSLEIGDGDGGRSLEGVLKHESVSKQVRVKKSVFSNDGKLIAIHESCQLLLFDGDKPPCSVFKVEENCEHTITCLTFSADDCLLLFCIQNGNHDQSVFVWDILKQVLCGPVEFPYRMSVDCGCFSSDNTKLILCDATSILILEDPPKFDRFSKHYNIPYVDFSSIQSCTHCTVSSDDKLFACCVANEILIFRLNGQNTFWKVPHNHLGRTEFCKFLKGNRYLISYGIDCVVVLFDIFEWKSVAYTRLQESIISMAVSPDEEKVVCLNSSGDVSILKLHGLKYGLPSNFQLPSNFGLPERSHEPSGTQKRGHVLPERHIIIPPNQTEFEEDEMMSADDFCESIDGDVLDGMYLESDHSEDHSDGDFDDDA